MTGIKHFDGSNYGFDLQKINVQNIWLRFPVQIIWAWTCVCSEPCWEQLLYKWFKIDWNDILHDRFRLKWFCHDIIELWPQQPVSLWWCEECSPHQATSQQHQQHVPLAARTDTLTRYPIIESLPLTGRSGISSSHINGLVQDCSISSVLAMEIQMYCSLALSHQYAVIHFSNELKSNVDRVPG